VVALGIVCTSAMIPKTNYCGAPGDGKSSQASAEKANASCPFIRHTS
jgi:hypothetical protein